MRKTMIAALATAGIALMGAAGASAAPVNGTVIDEASKLASPVDKTQHWRWGSGHHWRWGSGHGRYRSHWRWGSRGRW